jgi:hypothetical protein
VSMSMGLVVLDLGRVALERRVDRRVAGRSGRSWGCVAGKGDNASGRSSRGLIKSKSVNGPPEDIQAYTLGARGIAMPCCLKRFRIC